MEAAVTDVQKDTYYPKLLGRFNAFDTTLTLEEYRLLYYGFVFQAAYSGYTDHKKKEITEKLNDKDYASVLSLCDDVLKKIPVSLTAHYHKRIALYMLNKEDPRVKQHTRHYVNLLKAVVSSGDGVSCETAFKTIYVPDEYEVIYRYLEAKVFKGQLLKHPCDLLRFEPTQYCPAGEAYFDTSETFLQLEKTLKSN